MTDFSDNTAEELRDMAEFFEEKGWKENKEDCIEELESRSEPINPEGDGDIVGESEATLKEKLELFEDKGWEENAERVRAELERQEGMDSAEELTHVAYV